MGVTPTTLVVTVTGAGTPARATTSNIYARQVFIEPIRSMTGFAYIGMSTVSSTAYMAARTASQSLLIAASGEGKATSIAGGSEINLSTIYIDAEQAGARIMVTYIPRTDSK